ncbi:hypothetical protein DM02DRAFT_650853 [Periconia macrospinosa]|uniref:Uncharacterized protein n=1 Tax=Periconia macrospinosa TaxID=97972 RepID=A0A2V1E4D8_9PLEO|nr:hypothetical protein DM02DRAFT_650853 [Periconia macrospinosa]
MFAWWVRQRRPSYLVTGRGHFYRAGLAQGAKPDHSRATVVEGGGGGASLAACGHFGEAICIIPLNLIQRLSSAAVNRIVSHGYTAHYTAVLQGARMHWLGLLDLFGYGRLACSASLQDTHFHCNTTLPRSNQSDRLEHKLLHMPIVSKLRIPPLDLPLLLAGKSTGRPSAPQHNDASAPLRSKALVAGNGGAQKTPGNSDAVIPSIKPARSFGSTAPNFLSASSWPTWRCSNFSPHAPYA